MKYTKEQLKAVFKKLADDTNLPAEQIEAFNKALDHDGFATKVGSELVMTRSDYSRVMNDEVAPLKAKYQSEYEKLVSTWYPQAKAAFDKAASERDVAIRRLKAAEDRFGDLGDLSLNPDGTADTPAGDRISKSVVDKLIADAQAAAKAEAIGESVGLSLLMNELQADHWHEFREVVDLRPLTAAVKAKRDSGDMQFSLRDAYDAQYQPKIDEKRVASRQKELDDAVAAARRDERSKFATSPAAVVDEDSAGPFFAVQKFAQSGGKAPTEAELEAAFVNGIRETGDHAASAAASSA